MQFLCQVFFAIRKIGGFVAKMGLLADFMRVGGIFFAFICL
jgi:hypothetical protein